MSNQLNDLRAKFMGEQARIMSAADIPIDDATTAFVEDSFRSWLGTSAADSLGWDAEELTEAYRYYDLDEDAGTYSDNTQVALKRATAIQQAWVDFNRLAGKDFDITSGEDWDALLRHLSVVGESTANFSKMSALSYEALAKNLVGKDSEKWSEYQADPEGFMTDVYLGEEYGLDKVENPVARKLKSIPGMPGWLAQFVADDVLDPTSILVGGAVTGAGVGIAKAIMHLRNSRVPLKSMGAVRGFSKLLRESLEGAAGSAKFIDPETGKSMDFGSFDAPQLKLTKRSEFVDALKDIAPDFKLGRGKNLSDLLFDRTKTTDLEAIAKLDSELSEVLDQIPQPMAEHIIRLRLENVTTHEELLSLQRKFGKKYKFPKEFFNKSQLQEWFYNPRNGEIKRVDAGLLYDYVRNRKKYLHYDKDNNAVAFKGAEGRKLAKVLGAKDLQDVQILKDYNELAYLGRNPYMRFARLAMERARARGEVMGLTETGDWLGRNGLRHMRPMLENTGMQDVLIKNNQLASVSHQARMLEMTKALGGEVTGRGTGQLSLMLSQGLRATKKLPEIMKKAKDVGARVQGVFGERSLGDLDLLNLNDVLYYRLTDEVGRSALNAQRANEGLRPVQTNLFDPKIQKTVDEMAGNLRVLLDDMGAEAVGLGFMTPHQLLSQYLPRMRKELLSSGDDITDVIVRLEKRAIEQGDEKALPFFAMLRSGELDITEFSIPKIIEAYSRSLYNKKFITPMVKDMQAMVMDKRVGMDDRSRAFLLDFFGHLTGNVSKAQLAAQTSFQRLAKDGTSGLAPYAKGLFGDLWNNPVELSQMMRSTTRSLAGIYHVGFMGGKAFTAMRNMTQMFYSWRFLGSGLGAKKAKPYLLDGARRWNGDEAFRKRFHEMAMEQGWVENYFEFVEDVAETGLKGIGKKSRDRLLFMFKWADLNNRAVTYAAAESYVDDIFKNLSEGGSAWRAAANNMRASERAAFREAIDARDLETARRIYGKFVVNETQYLYHPLNRMLGFRTGKDLADKMLNTMFLFQSWNMHNTEELVNILQSGARGKFGPGVAVGASKSALDWMLPMVMLGYTLELAAGDSGMHPGDWVLPRGPDWWKKLVGAEEGEGNRLQRLIGGHFPAPIKPVVGIVNMFLDAKELPLTYDLVMQGTNLAAYTADEVANAMVDGEEIDWNRAAFMAFFQTLPRLMVADPILQDLIFEPDDPRQRLVSEKISLRLESDPQYQSFIEMVAAGLVQNPDPWTERGEMAWWQRAAKASGMPIRNEP